MCECMECGEDLDCEKSERESCLTYSRCELHENEEDKS